MTDINVIKFDRTRSITYQECPRRRYWNFHHAGTGIVPSKLYVPYATGSWAHHGFAALLSGIGIEKAVSDAVDSYRAEIAHRGLQLNPGEAESYLMDEQCALVEAMLRAYHKVRLGELLGTFEVLEVEREDEWTMARIPHDRNMERCTCDAKGNPGASHLIECGVFSQDIPLVLMARADALLLERVSGDLYIQSFKTAASYDRRTAGEANHDVQGLSEVAATEARLYKRWHQLHDVHGPTHGKSLLTGEAQDKTDVMLLAKSEPPRISGVRMEYIIKGRREEFPAESGHWEQYSPLIRGYVKEGITCPEFGWKREWKDPSDGRSRKLDYRTWKAFHVWEQPGGVKAWIDLLATGTVQPEAGECLPSQFVTPMPYFRDEDDLRSWYESTVYQERHIAENLFRVEQARDEGERKSLLNQLFPHVQALL